MKFKTVFFSRLSYRGNIEKVIVKIINRAIDGFFFFCFKRVRIRRVLFPMIIIIIIIFNYAVGSIAKKPSTFRLVFHYQNVRTPRQSTSTRTINAENPM